jgi:hypothetical protein
MTVNECIGEARPGAGVVKACGWGQPWAGGVAPCEGRATGGPDEQVSFTERAGRGGDRSWQRETRTMGVSSSAGSVDPSRAFPDRAASGAEGDGAAASPHVAGLWSIGCVRFSSPASVIQEALTRLPDTAYPHLGYGPSGKYGEAVERGKSG